LRDYGIIVRTTGMAYNTAGKETTMAIVSPRDEAREQAEQIRKNQAAIELLGEWLAEEPDPEEEAAWQQFKEDLEEDRLSIRERFGD
jgi:hypothetical protein